MEAILFKVGAFVIAIGVLVTVHEFGHFWVARKLGVKVLRFSVGFGRPLVKWRGRTDGTEYVIAAIPMGGYVKMLDEREADVPHDELPRAFNRKSLAVRSAVIVAGPAFNFAFAILAFWLVLVVGEVGLRPLIGDVTLDSPAAQVGLEPGDEILAVDAAATPTWSAVLYRLAASSVSADAVSFEVRKADGSIHQRQLPAAWVGDLAEREDLLGDLGVTPDRPRAPPIIGKLLAGEAAEQAGLQPGDRILEADGVVIADWSAWVKFVKARPEHLIKVTVARAGTVQTIDLIPTALTGDDGKVIGRIGAVNEQPAGLYDDYRVVYRLGVWEAVPVAVDKTVEFSVLTLKVLGKILIGDASVRNLSGPITIADTAGRTASVGWVQFVKFLAIVSISLGVLNLLPIPVLDGGHLLFNIFEAIKGGPLSDEFLLQGQRVGLAILLSLMGLAFYVDISRYLG